jgi:thermitase
MSGFYHDLDAVESQKPQVQWSLRATHVRQAWSHSRGGGVVVAIVDSGVGPTWELDGQLVPGINIAGPVPPRVDNQDHGTAVACVIAARDDGRGINGVAPAAEVMSVRAFSRPNAPNPRVAWGVRWAVDHGADVLSLSFDDTRDNTRLRQSIRYALDRKVIVVASAGNDGDEVVEYPASYPGVIGVGAVRPSLDLAGFSTEGADVDVVAPGVHVLSCDPFDTLSWYSGTSFATPIVAGIVALMKADHPGLTPKQAERTLRGTADDLGDPGRDIRYGSGLVDADRALRSLHRG